MRLGTVVSGTYRLDELLGVGITAASFAATHRNGQRVALKLLHREHSQRRAVKARFLFEGYRVNRVEHAGAVRITDHGVDDLDCPYLAMELLHGLTVEKLCRARGGRLSLGLSLAIADATLAVLAAAHGAGIVHHGVKPANLFVTRLRSLKLLDFGMAGLLGGTDITRTGELRASAGFTAPEQARGDRSTDPRVDVWAFGATLFSLLSGRHVHEAMSERTELLLAATTLARPLASVAPEMPSAVCVVVDRALAFDPERRWQSAGEMRAALRKLHEFRKFA